MIHDEVLEYSRLDNKSDFEKEVDRWKKAASKYFPDVYTILGVEYFDNSEISNEILDKHKISNDAYMIIAAKIDRYDGRSDVFIEQKWVDRWDFNHHVHVGEKRVKK